MYSCLSKSKKKTLKKSKLIQSQNDSCGLISFLGQLEGKKNLLPL